ncbi:DUF4097 family beta strand repeat-containing protein [Echinicola arenosa]|nr:DUF4097 family beta strand repeat-containing protein [Echinicola arenosa]
MMKHNYKILTVALVFVAALLPGCSYSQMTVVSDIEEVFDGITAVEIHGGPLEVTYEGRDLATEVSLNAYLESNKSNGVEITYEVKGDKLLVKWEQSKGFSGWGNFRNEGFISVTGPKEIELKVNSGSGTAFVSNVNHEEIDLSAGSGHLKASELNVSKIHLSVGSGKIEGEDLIGDVYCKVSSGEAHLDDVKGNVDAIGSSGKISLEDISGKVDAKISSGRIVLDDIGELGELIGSSGSISADNAGLGGDTDLKFSSGSVHIQTPDNLDNYNFELAASSGSLRVGNQKTGKSLRIDNNSSKTVRGAVSSGNITIEN